MDFGSTGPRQDFKDGRFGRSSLASSFYKDPPSGRSGLEPILPRDPQPERVMVSKLGKGSLG
jgi:hypothetical protein